MDAPQETFAIEANNIKQYLRNRRYPTDFDKNAKRVLRRRCDSFFLRDDVLFFRGRSGDEGSKSAVKQSMKRLVILSAQEQIETIHDVHTVSGAHLGRDKTTESVAKRFFWPGMVRDVREFVKHCDVCQHYKPRLRKAKSTRNPVPVPVSVWKQDQFKMSAGEEIEMIIDCDPGVDDAVAIMMALSQPSVNLLAITCVGGNTPIDNVLRNALRVLRVCNRTDVPVYRGSGNSLLNLKYADAHHVHGSDGLGGVPDPDPPSLDLIQSEHAVHAMIRMTKERPGQVTMVAIGPLTNLALAIRLDPGFTGRLKKLVIMGGNTEGSGSMTDAAEFNFFVDPEAAHIVLHDVQCPTTVVGWETCLKNGLPWEWFNKWSATPTPKGKFINAILAGQFMMYERGEVKRPLFKVCDALAMAVVIRPEMVLESLICPVMIELSGQVTRGQMVKRVKNTEGLPQGPKVEVVLRCNTEILRVMFEDILAN